MSPITDTSREADRVQVGLLRQMPVWRKLELMGQLNELNKSLVLSDLRERFPQATEPELQRLLADRLLGLELAKRTYGPAPEWIAQEEAAGAK